MKLNGRQKVGDICRYFTPPRAPTGSIQDRRLHHGPELVAQHIAVAGLHLGHVDGDQILLRIDEEQRASVTAPPILADRPGEGRLADLGAYGEAETKAPSGGEP